MEAVNLLEYILFLLAVNSSFASDEIESHPNLNLLPKDCGSINEDYIISNRPHFEEFPWLTLLATVHKDKGGKTRFICDGTLINSKYVLTVAHCVRHNNITEVRIGEYDIETDPDCEGSGDDIICAAPYRDISVEKAIVHPEYNSLHHVNDIAILRLKESVNLKSSNSGVICLPTGNDLRTQDLNKVFGTLVGWKLHEEPSNMLKQRVEVLSDEDCKKVDSDYFRRVGSQTLNQLCAAGSLFLDSGSPLMIKRDFPDYKKYVQLGILSTGLESSTIGHYTDVRKYMKWILDTIQP